jgi:hypothetical protein
MEINFKPILTACVFALLAACGNNNNAALSTTEAKPGSPLGYTPSTQTLSMEAYKPAASEQTISPMKSRDLSIAPVAAQIALGTPLASMSAAANATAAVVGKPLQVGFSREVNRMVCSHC